jgi:hypothetical protein
MSGEYKKKYFFVEKRGKFIVQIFSSDSAQVACRGVETLSSVWNLRRKEN